MRHVSALLAVVLLLTVVFATLAQVGRDIRFVTVDVAEVRALASDSAESYVTNRLRRGQPVEVVNEMPGGWLAIRPPEGSFSYIHTRFLRHLSPDLPNHVVQLDGVEVGVYVGSEVVNKRPTVVGARLAKGTQVISRGKPLTDDQGTWMPIEPPSREQRFVRATQVAKQMPTPGSEPAKPANAAVVKSTFTPAATPPSANPPRTPVQLWQQAQDAERVGQLGEAIRLYALVGAEAAQTQPTLSAQALDRARFLQGGHQQYGAQVPATNTVQVGQPSVAHVPVSRAAATAPPPQPPPPRGTPASWMRYRGVLRRAGRVIEGQVTYALDEIETLRPVLYASSGTGVRLDAYLNQVVELWGYTVYRGDLKNNYMTAVKVVPSQ